MFQPGIEELRFALEGFNLVQGMSLVLRYTTLLSYQINDKSKIPPFDLFVNSELRRLGRMRFPEQFRQGGFEV